jgi:hypothetical protein
MVLASGQEESSTQSGSRENRPRRWVFMKDEVYALPTKTTPQH